MAMAMYLRRVISQRSTIQLLRSRTSIQSRSLSHLLPFSSNHRGRSCDAHFVFPVDFCRNSVRGFAKGRKSKDDAAESIAVAPEIGPTIKANVSSQMEAAIDALSRELTKLRTGRASPGMLDHIIVETSGIKMPLNHVAVVSVLDSKTLSVNPYDPDSLKQLETAIRSSPLGLNPLADGQRLIATIPPLTKEHMQAVCKLVAKSSEDVKQSIRRARQKALDTIKKAGSSFPKDEAKRIEKEVDELTKKFIKNAEEMCKAKGKEITVG